jgi:hypothetical protein
MVVWRTCRRETVAILQSQKELRNRVGECSLGQFGTREVVACLDEREVLTRASFCPPCRTAGTTRAEAGTGCSYKKVRSAFPVACWANQIYSRAPFALNHARALSTGSDRILARQLM